MNRFKPTASHRRTTTIGGQLARALAAAILTAAVVTATAVSGTTACGICGKNLIKNPGAEAGLGITAVDAFGAVPGWTNEAGQFGAASYTFPNGWFSKNSKGSPKRGKNYFFGGTTPNGRRGQGDDREADDQASCSRGRSQGDAQRLARQLRETELRAGASAVRGRRRQGAQRGQDRPGHDDLGHRHAGAEPQRTVPAGAKQVTIVVTFGGTTAAYKLAGADDLSLVLA